MCHECDRKANTRDGEALRPDRRTFLQASAGTLGAAALARTVPAVARTAHPKPKTRTKNIVILFLRGGADWVQLIPPTGENAYYSHRPGLAIARPGTAGGVNEGLPLDPSNPGTSPFSFHPNMPNLHAEYIRTGSNLAIVGSAGYSPASRSHFSSMDIIETADVGGSGQGTGWVNRLLQVMPGEAPIRALAMRSTMPLGLAGPAQGAFSVSSISGLEFPAAAAGIQGELEDILKDARAGYSPATRRTYAGMQETVEFLDFFASFDPTQYPPQNGAVYGGDGFSRRMREIAQLIRADIGVEVFQVEYGGWDHHSGIQSRLDPRALIVDQALGAFLRDLGTLMRDTVLVTITDFGREVPENGSAGTDHGVGQAMLVMGGAVKGGDPGGGAQVYGPWAGMNNLLRNRYVQTTVDYRDVFGEVLAEHLNLPVNDLAHVFPGLSYSPLGLI